MDPDLLTPKHLPDEHVENVLKGFLAQTWGKFQELRYSAAMAPESEELAEAVETARERYLACLEFYEADLATLKTQRASKRASEKLARTKENGREKAAGKPREVALAGEPK